MHCEQLASGRRPQAPIGLPLRTSTTLQGEAITSVFNPHAYGCVATGTAGGGGRSTARRAYPKHGRST